MPLVLDGKTYEPVRFAADGSQERCNDCGILKGGMHHFGCDRELCPVCGGQLISCGCWDECMEHLCGDDDESEDEGSEGGGLGLM